MDQFDDWLQRISEGKINAALKNEIADKILELLEQKKGFARHMEKNTICSGYNGVIHKY